MDGYPDIDLVGRAAALGQSSASVAHDLGALLFPKSDVVISDRMLSSSRQYLHKIVADIETEICRLATETATINEILEQVAESERPQSFVLLKQAGVFDKPEILNHVFVEAQRGELNARLLQKTSQEDLEGALTRNLDHEDATIAEAAMALLIAQNRIGSAGSADIAELPAEILYELAWPIVAAIEKISSASGAVLADAADRLLASHDESQSVQVRSARLANLLEQDDQKDGNYPNPFRDGLELSLARLACRTGLKVEQLILFTADVDMVRMAVTLRGLNIPADDALSIFAALGGPNSLLTKASYSEIAIEEAQDLVAKWSMNGAYQNAVRRIANAEPDNR